MSWEDTIRKQKKEPYNQVVAEIRKLLRPEDVESSNIYNLTYYATMDELIDGSDDLNYDSMQELAQEANKLERYIEEFYLSVRRYFENPISEENPDGEEYSPVGIRWFRMTKYDQRTIQTLKTIIETISTMEIPVAFRTRLRTIIDNLKQAVDEMVNKRWIWKQNLKV